MRLLIGLAQSLDRHMRVDLRRRNGSVAKHLLYSTDVRAVRKGLGADLVTDGEAI